MHASLLGGIAMSFQPVWGRLRSPVAVRLSLMPASGTGVDASHLFATLADLWSPQAPRPWLHVLSAPLLNALLDQAGPDTPALEIPQAWAQHAGMDSRLARAHKAGATLVWHGETGQALPPPLSSHVTRSLLSLNPEQALLALRASLQRSGQLMAVPPSTTGASPVLAGQVYEHMPSRALAEHALDQQLVHGLLDWPNEEVLHGYRYQQVQPEQRCVVRLLKAIEADAAMDVIEQLLSEEPVLAYRFLRFTNSAGVGLRNSIESLRHGLMMLGCLSLKNWLMEQLPCASSDLNLQPIRTSMVLRARLMEHLLDAGAEHELRRELYLCGLFAQLPLLLGEPAAAVFSRIPLPERLVGAIVSGTGPYAPYLGLANALASDDPGAVRQLCREHDMDLESINRALLRTLGGVPSPVSAELLA